MPSLSDMLEDTMLFVAARGKGIEPEPFGAGGINPTEPPIPQKAVDGVAAKTLPIWHWVLGASPNEVAQVSCISRGMHNSRMLVCENISFHNIRIKAKLKQSNNLPLTDPFVIGSFFLNNGRVNAFDPSKASPGSHFLYPLAAELDKSFLIAYAFDFPNGIDQDPEHVPEEAINKTDFMPSVLKNDGKKALPGQQLLVTQKPLRVVVFESLVCCKENNDFDPGGLLGGARMTPHLMIMTNQPVSDVFGEIRQARPAKMTMMGKKHKHSNMNHTIENGLWADNNDAAFIGSAPLGLIEEALDAIGIPNKLSSISGLPSPFWDDLFACYLVDDPKENVSGKFKVVRPDKGARTVIGAVKQLQDLFQITSTSKPYENRDFRRLPRQGAFDNIHQAPTMKEVGSTRSGFHGDKIYMAPFCEHDCLHTHWRWSIAFKEKQVHGWSNSTGTGIVPGRPYSVAGAPMVPENQFVELEFTSLSAYKYKVHAKGANAARPNEDIAPGTYTFMNHHGSDYAVFVDASEFSDFTKAKAYVMANVFINKEPTLKSTPFLPGTQLRRPDEVMDLDNSEYLYWHLRWGGQQNFLNPDKVQERLKIINLKKIKDD